MRLAFMGTPEFAVPTLDALLEAGHEVVAVYTQPPRPGGRRGKEPTPSPVHKRAGAAGIEVRTPERLRGPEEQAAFAALDLDAAVVAAYGLILPEPILQAPRHGCLNVHASLLPRWRGAAPIQRAILAGDEMTGVCIMGMEKGLDTGPVYACRGTEIGGKTAGELTAELAGMGGALMADVLNRLGDIVPEPQPEEGVTYAHKIDKAEARIDFERTAEEVERQVRAFNPVPGAYFEHQGERVKVLAARVIPGVYDPGVVLDDHLAIGCGSGALMPTLVQRAGKGAMTAADLLRGFAILAGTRLG
ncbi:MAG: methionyl-tRNA formyltransferase [Allosphingosinicella sp.]|uniref:methionyl-tRNA formyltransferase n=1 Tax=Allosphingosinicella sp. TaxID=2823234 RepID=UPI003953EFD9